jgi:hypothetical protein
MSNQRQNKVLRIGIIQDGKIVQERLIKAGESVTVGDSSKNTFVLPKSSLGTPSFTIFKAAGKGYQLQFTEAMKGKISAGGGAVVALQKAAEDPQITRKDGVLTLPLTEQDRGKIQIDSVTVLFQFVAPPPPKAAKPIQQLDFRPRMLAEDDPVFIGFLGVWSALGLVLAIWVWSVDPEAITLDDIPDEYVKLIVEPPKVEDPIPVEPAPDAAGPEKEVETEAQEAMKEAKTSGQKAKAESARKSELINNSKLLLKLIGTTGDSSNGVVANLWSDQEQGLGDVNAALQNTAGATTNAGDATRVGNMGGNGAAGIGELGSIGGGQGGDAAVKVIVKPKVSTGAGSVAATGDENQVKATVAKFAGQLQYCYEKQLKVVPTLEGRIEVGWSVAGGAVTGKPYVVSNTTNDAELADCVTQKIRRWTFPADVEGDMSYPFLFQLKK